MLGLKLVERKNMNVRTSKGTNTPCILKLIDLNQGGYHQQCNLISIILNE